jgi:SAM-dependent methyltransferase
MVRDYKAWWTNDELNNCWPGDGKAGGWDETEWIRKHIAQIYTQYGRRVLDYGCGPGRHTSAFDPRYYTGVDLNPRAIIKAQDAHPEATFREIDFLEDLPECGLILAWTVLLHIHDEHLAAVITQLTNIRPQYIVIAEIMDKRWRAISSPLGPFYQRDFDDYLGLLYGHSYTLVENHRIPYQRYANHKASDIFEVAIFEEDM